MTDKKQDLPVVMIVRHAEKPGFGPENPRGVDNRGEHSDHSLTPRGWSRAGALGALFSAVHSQQVKYLVEPQRVLATKATHSNPSRREVDTAGPVAGKLGLPVEDHHARNKEVHLATEVISEGKPTLIVWDHGHIPELARAFPLVDASSVPHQWESDRYDLIWVLVPTDRGYELQIVEQDLLTGDEARARQ